MSDHDNLSRAHQLLASGQLDEARIYLEELLRQDPDNTDLLYNLGLCYVDLGQLDQGRELLHRCLQLMPGHSHACVALALGYQRASDLPRAREYTMQALAADARNPVALKNLGAILGQEGDSLRALYYLRRSYECDPLDPQTVYGLAFAYMELGDIEPAQKHFQAVLVMEASEELRSLARKGLSKIAARELKARGPRMDAVFYPAGPCGCFAGSRCRNHFNIGRSSTFAMDHFDQALNFIQAGRLDEARIYLEELLKQDPENVDLLYNLGMLYTDLGKPDMSITLLKQCIKLSPRHANAHVALGFAYMSSGDLKSAKEYTLQALKIVPNDPIALRNLGGIFGKEKDFLNAFYHLQKSYDINPHDSQTVYGLAFAYKSLNDFENAEKHFKALLDMRSPDTLKELAREGLGEIAFKTLKSQGPRMDVVMYILSALETFKGKSTQKVKDISFEIGMLGRQGFEINDPSKKFTLRTLPGEFTALQLVSMMYTGFKQFEPSLDIGMDFSEEYGLALKLAQSEDLR